MFTKSNTLLSCPRCNETNFLAGLFYDQCFFFLCPFLAAELMEGKKGEREKDFTLHHTGQMMVRFRGPSAEAFEAGRCSAGDCSVERVGTRGLAG